MSERYSRQELFAPIGKAGQEKIKYKHVLVLGCGALGSSLTEMLVRGGIGHLTMIDRDYVEMSNLQRQNLFTESDALERQPKAIAAKKRLLAINSDVRMTAIVADATVPMLEELLPDIDLIIDATDNFETRMILNDLSQQFMIPWIYGACVGSVGMSFTILPGKTPCLNCLLNAIPMQGMTCDTGGIISPAVQMTTAHQVSEAMKILVEDFDALRGDYLYFDLWRNESKTIRVGKVKNKDCLSCGEKPSYPFLAKENQMKPTVLCGRDTVQIRPARETEIDFTKLSEQLEKAGFDVSINPFLLSVQFETERMVIFKDGRAMVHGTKDIAHAKTIYHRFLG